MEVFTVVEHRVDAAPEGRRRCGFTIPFVIALAIQSIVAILLTTLLLWNLVDIDAAKNALPIFGRLTVIICLLISFYSQQAIFTAHAEIEEGRLIANLVVYIVSILMGNTFWLIHMQYWSGLSPGVVNYTAIEPVIFTTGCIVGIYCLRRVCGHYEACRTEELELDIYTKPIFPKALICFAIIEAVYGIVFAILMNLVVPYDYEMPKRCGCLISIYVSAIVNELAIVFSKETKSALLTKTMGFFVHLVATQLTWWLSYYKERQLTLYGLGVGFLSLLFGVLYTVEMSLQTAQLNNHTSTSGGGRNERQKQATCSISQSGDYKASNDPAVTAVESESGCDTESAEETSTEGTRILNHKTIVALAVFLQIGLGLLPVIVLLLGIISPTADLQKLKQDLIGNWSLWAVGFLAALLLNEIILFQNKVYYLMVCICNGAFCLNFCLGCVISYQGIMVSMEGHGIPINFIVVGSMWVPYFILSHLDFVRLTRFSLKLEERQIRRLRDSKISLFVASGIQSMVAIAAFVPSTDFWYFPGKVHAILTFPSLTFIAEVIFYFGKKCRGPFLVTFTAFFLGTGYGQVVWYISVILDEEEEFLGLTKPWLFGLGLTMGVLAWLYVLRFLHCIITRWEKRE